MSRTVLCEQCDASFARRTGNGSKPQRFCSPKCRQAFHAQREQRGPTCSNVGQSPAVMQPAKKAQAIFAELIGSNTCTAAGVTVVDHAPVLALCRALVTAGQDSNRPLHAYRGDVLCLCVRIGEGVRLTVEDDRHGRPRLRRWRNRPRRYGAAPLARQIGNLDAIANGCER